MFLIAMIDLERIRHIDAVIVVRYLLEKSCTFRFLKMSIYNKTKIYSLNNGEKK